MKILFFAENTHCGGLDTFFISLVNHWPNPEDELVFVCNASHPGVEFIRQNLKRQCIVAPHKVYSYIDVVLQAEGSRILRGGRKLFYPLLRLILVLHGIWRLRNEFSKHRPERLMIISGGYPGGDTCWSALLAWGIFFSGRPRAIYNFHNLATVPRWFERWPEKIRDRLLLRYARSLISVSRACAETLKMRLAGAARVSWIYNGIVAPAGVPSTASGNLRTQLGYPEDALLCLMLATYEPRKGHDFLLRAFKRVVDEVPLARLLICGYGYPDEMKRVAALVRQYGLMEYVTLQEFRQDTDILLEQTDLLLVASQAYESFGLTCVEAMARRVPVVATRVGGLPEVVADGEGGFCIDPDDEDGYAACVEKFLSDAEFRKAQGEKGYRRYQELFTASRMALQYAEVVRAEDVPD